MEVSEFVQLENQSRLRCCCQQALWSMTCSAHLKIRQLLFFTSSCSFRDSVLDCEEIPDDVQTEGNHPLIPLISAT